MLHVSTPAWGSEISGCGGPGLERADSLGPIHVSQVAWDPRQSPTHATRGAKGHPIPEH
jgi:hypothetical protein